MSPKLTLSPSLQDPRRGCDGQRALPTHLALHQPFELALEQSAAEGDGEGHHLRLQGVTQELVEEAEVGLLGDQEGCARQSRQARADKPGRFVLYACGFGVSGARHRFERRGPGWGDVLARVDGQREKLTSWNIQLPTMIS